MRRSRVYVPNRGGHEYSAVSKFGDTVYVTKVKQVRLVSGRSCCIDLEVWSFSPRERKEVTYRLTRFTKEDVVDYVDQRWPERGVCDA